MENFQKLRFLSISVFLSTIFAIFPLQAMAKGRPFGSPLARGLNHGQVLHQATPLSGVASDAVNQDSQPAQPGEQVSESQGNQIQPPGLNTGNKLKTPEFAPSQIIVKLKQGKTLADIQDLNDKYQVTSTDKIFKDSPSAQDTLKKFQDKLANLSADHQTWYWQLDKNSQEYKDYMAQIEKEKAELTKQIQFQQELIARLEQRQKRAPEGTTPPDLENNYLLKTNDTTDILSMVAEYKADPNVEFAQPDYKNVLYSLINSWGQGYDDLWGLKTINAEQAWTLAQGDGVIVAVIDTGVDYNHEDLAANIWSNSLEVAGNGFDDDSNGFMDDIRGYDFSGNTDNVIVPDTDPIDYRGHGTHVAGTIAAIGNNNLDFKGIAPKSKIMPIKIFPNSWDSVIAAGIYYAVNNGADILQNSWGPQGRRPSNSEVELAIDYAYSKGCIIVFGAGNNNDDVAYYSPANYSKVITVAASDHKDLKWDLSNWGKKIDLTAPGGESEFWIPGVYPPAVNASKASIVSLRANNTDMFLNYNGYTPGSAFYPIQGQADSKYYRSLGTSMACPHVSGLAALIISKHPAFTQAQITARIIGSTYSIDSLNPAYVDKLGSGRINLNNAIRGINLHPHLVLESATTYRNVFPGSTKNLTVILNNKGEVANNVSLFLTTQDQYVTITQNQASYGSISTGQLAIPFSFSIAQGSPGDRNIQFSLAINASGYTKTINFSLYVTPLPVLPADATCSPGLSFGDRLSLGGSATSQPAIESFQGRLIIMVRGANGSSIWVKELKDTTGTPLAKDWYSLPGSTSARPKLVNTGNALYAYVIGSNGVTVWRNEYRGIGVWTAWENTGLAAYQFGASGPGAVIANSGTYMASGKGPIYRDRCVVSPLSAPTNPTATAVSSTQIYLTWQNSSTNVTCFKIERKFGLKWAQIATIGADRAYFTDSYLVAGQNYSYRIRASNTAGDSAYSITASTKPILFAPTGLRATTVPSTRIDLSWTDTSPDEEGFEIERKLGLNPWQLIATVPANTRTYSNTSSLTSGKTYSYRVRAYVGTVKSSYSNTANATF